jgi:DNA polymerase-3 subunit alpha
MERLGVKSAAEVLHGLRVGDSVRSKLAGCVNSFQKRVSKNGNKYAFLEMSDGSSNFEGLLFSDGLARYEDIINSGNPLLVSVTIDKKEEEAAPRMMINTVELLDQAIAEVANGLEVYINDVQAVKTLRQVLSKDRNGQNKIYIKPDNDSWDIRIALNGGFALFGDILSQIRAIPGISKVKEI